MGTVFALSVTDILNLFQVVFLSCFNRLWVLPLLPQKVFGLANAVEAVPRTPWPIGQMFVFPRHPRLIPVLLVEICFLQPNGNWHGTDLVPNLPNGLNRS